MTTSRPRPRCRNCSTPARKGHPLVNGYCSNACAVAAIMNRPLVTA